MDTERRAHIRMVRQEAGRKGGRATLERYGTEHYRKLQQRSWQTQVQRDPNAGFRLGHAGLRSMDPVPQNRAWTNNQYDPNRQEG